MGPPFPRPRRRCVRSPHRDRDADAALGHAIALSYAQAPRGAEVIFLSSSRRCEDFSTVRPWKRRRRLDSRPTQGPGAWGANEIIMPDGARFSMLEADPMKLTYY